MSGKEGGKDGTKKGARELAKVEKMAPDIASETPTTISVVERMQNKLIEGAQELAQRVAGEADVSNGQLWLEVKQFEAAAAYAIFMSGARLVLLRRRLGRGNFQEEVRKHGIHERVAQNRMAVTVKMLGPNLDKFERLKLGDLGINKLMELSTLDDDELDDLCRGEEVLGLVLDDVQRMSASELRKRLKKVEDEVEEARAAQKDAEDTAAQLKRDNDRLRRQWSKTEISDRILQRRSDVEALVLDVEKVLGDYSAFEDAIHTNHSKAPQHGLAAACNALLAEAAEVDGVPEQSAFLAAIVRRLETSVAAFRDSLPVALPEVSA